MTEHRETVAGFAPTPSPTPGDEPAATLMRNLLEASIIFTAQAASRYVASEPGVKAAADAFASTVMAGTYAGAAARLLHALMSSPDQAVARAVADQLSEWLAFGEPLADWVTEQASERGIDVDALIEGVRS